MLYLSEILLQGQHEMETFSDLEQAVHRIARQRNERFFRMDVRPPFTDTPDNWEDRLEASFY